MNRIQDKIKEIECYIEELESIVPLNLEDYLSNLEKLLACERAFEKIIEAVNDLAILFIRQKRYDFSSEAKIFDILSQRNIISKILGERLQQAKGMRNFLIHGYDDVDLKVVWKTVQEDIPLLKQSLKNIN